MHKKLCDQFVNWASLLLGSGLWAPSFVADAQLATRPQGKVKACIYGHHKLWCLLEILYLSYTLKAVG